MGRLTKIAENLDTIEFQKAALDTVCKKLLANKSVLAWILKTCVEEYKDCTVKEIEEKYIEGTPKIAEVSVHQDELSEVERADYIKGTGNEDKSILEGTVTYDIKFDAISPTKKNTYINLIINIESQTDYYPGYPLTKRGVYYGSRMISAQYGTVFNKSHYEKLEKVYSIWVCINPPQYRENSINLYTFKETCMVGNVKEKKENYDLMTVVMICLGDMEDEACQGVIKLLSVLLSMEKDVEEKKEILENEFDIAMTQTMEKEAEDMCDYSKYIEEKGIASGIIEGILTSLRNLIETTGMSVEQAMNALKVPEEDKNMYMEILNKQQ